MVETASIYQGCLSRDAGQLSINLVNLEIFKSGESGWIRLPDGKIVFHPNDSDGNQKLNYPLFQWLKDTYYEGKKLAIFIPPQSEGQSLTVITNYNQSLVEIRHFEIEALPDLPLFTPN